MRQGERKMWCKVIEEDAVRNTIFKSLVQMWLLYALLYRSPKPAQTAPVDEQAHKVDGRRSASSADSARPAVPCTHCGILIQHGLEQGCLSCGGGEESFFWWAFVFY